MVPPVAFHLYLTIALLLVILYDSAKYIIPNWLNLAILFAYPVAAYMLPLAWLPALGAAAIILLVGLGIFSLGLMGGGDIKLLTVLGLWTGWHAATLQFIMLTAMFGGALVVIVLLARFFIAPIWVRLSRSKSIPRLLRTKQPVPYGIAIAAAFLFLLYQHQVPGLG